MDDRPKPFSNVPGGGGRTTRRNSTSSEGVKKTRIAAPQEETGSMHLINARYWADLGRSREAVSEHQRRQKRLEEIQSELVELCLR